MSISEGFLRFRWSKSFSEELCLFGLFLKVLCGFRRFYKVRSISLFPKESAVSSKWRVASVGVVKSVFVGFDEVWRFRRISRDSANIAVSSRNRGEPKGMVENEESSGFVGDCCSNNIGILREMVTEFCEFLIYKLPYCLFINIVVLKNTLHRNIYI